MLSYTDLAVTTVEADAYAQARGWANWTGDTAAKTAALRRGQDYIAGAYNARWIDEFESDATPEAVKYAIIEAARRELVEPGSLSPDVTLGRVKKSVRVEGAVAVEYAGSGVADQLPVLTAIDGLLAGLLRPGRTRTYVSTFARA